MSVPAEPAATAQQPGALRRSLGSIWSILFWSVLILGLVSFRFIGFELFAIPSASMTPTLLAGDYIVVSKFAYGYSRYSFPAEPNFPHGRIFGSLPERGDVAVFVNPRTGEDYIKRIVGLPGDRIQMVHGILTINGQPCKRGRIDDYTERNLNEHYHRTFETTRYRYVEMLPNGGEHEILGEVTTQPEDSLPQDDTAVFQVPDGSFFAIGDNRDNSMDSRFQGGDYIPLENLIGRAEFRLFSVESFGRLFGSIR